MLFFLLVQSRLRRSNLFGENNLRLVIVAAVVLSEV